MYKFDEDMFIDNFPAVVYRQLVDELGKDHCWNKLAEHVAERLGFIGSTWIKSLENEGSNNCKRSPAENLLEQLNMRMCTVEVLCNLLKECNLLNALSILHQPEPLIITEQPNCDKTDVEIALGKYLKLKCRAIGLPPPSYTWYHENVPLSNQNNEELNLFIDNIEQEGGYKCLVTQSDSSGLILNEIYSNSVYLKVKPTPVIINIQPLSFVEIKKGNTLELICKAESHPPPQYQWFRDNTKLEMQWFNTLRIENFEAKHEGKYYCQVTNNISEVYSNKSIVVIDLPREKAAAKIALLIANDDYDYHMKLKTPRNDVAKLAELLEQIGFQVISLLNLTVDQMRNAMKLFCALLSDGVYGLFYFAGHGFKMQENYMLAVDAPISFLRSDALCESELLATVLPTDPALLVVILDTCQTLPAKDLNPDIYKEIPTVNEYRSQKNLRNLIQAYSTSSHRPSYERCNTNCGMYVTHLSKYITRDIPVQKVFEETGKSIDVWFKGKERNQIPMFALTITKPFRLTDAIYAGNQPEVIKKLQDLIAFPNRKCDLIFKQSEIHCNLIVSQLIKPYLNVVKLNVSDIGELVINLYNSVAIERNNLFQSSQKNEFHVHNPQTSKGPLVISIERDGAPIGATIFQIMDYCPPLLRKL